MRKMAAFLAFAMVGCVYAQTKIDYVTQVRRGPAVIDTAYTTLAAACTAAAGVPGMLNVTKAWTAVPTTSCNAVVNFVGSSASIQPASGATFTMNGYTAVNRHQSWDLSASGSVRLSSGAAGTTIYAGNFSTFAGACATAVASTSTLQVDAPITVSADTTCAAKIYAGPNGVITVSASVLTLTGAFAGDASQHFTLVSAGTVDLSGATVVTYYLQWFGTTAGFTFGSQLPVFQPGTTLVPVFKSSSTASGAAGAGFQLEGLTSTTATSPYSKWFYTLNSNTNGSQQSNLHITATVAAADVDVVGSDNTGHALIKPPTSCSGIATGTLWNNSGTLAICP